MWSRDGIRVAALRGYRGGAAQRAASWALPGRDRSVLDLQQKEGVEREDDGEEDRRAVQVALDHRAAADRAATAADPEGAGEAGVFARVEQDQEDQHDS